MPRQNTLIGITGLAGMALSSSAWAQANNSCSNATPIPLGGFVNGSTSSAAALPTCGTRSLSPARAT
jgi:hypothetical protein